MLRPRRASAASGTQAKGKTGGKENAEAAVGEAVHLRRTIGIVPATCFVISSVIGSGIFIAPKGVLMNCGSVGLSLLVWALCGVISLLGALCYAELGTTFTKSGGYYTYLLETLGPLPAFLRLWVELLFIRPAGFSYLTLAFARYAAEPFFVPCDTPPALIKLVSILGVTAVVAINCWSVTLVSRMQVVLTIIKVVALGLIIVPGTITLYNGNTENFQKVFDMESSTLDRLPLAFYNGLYAYGGWFYINLVTEEVINPNRTLPLAIICSMVIVTVFYLLVNLAYFAVMTPAELLASDAVVVTFSNLALQGMSSTMPVLVAICCLGTLNSVLFATPRMLFVGAREGHCPVLFSMINIRRLTPVPAVILMYPMVVLMVMNGNIFQLINFAGCPGWFFIALTTLGLIIHRLRFPDHPRPFKVPLVIPATFTLVCFFIVGMSLYSDPWTTGGSCLLTLTGVPIYYLTIHRSCLPASWTRVFHYVSNQMQILLMVIPQEVQTH